MADDGFKPGEFIEGNWNDKVYVGRVTHVDVDGSVRHEIYSPNFPDAIIAKKLYGYTKVSEEEALRYFRQELVKLDINTIFHKVKSLWNLEHNLSRAVAARKNLPLENIIRELQSSHVEVSMTPNTGTYVLMGSYSGQEESVYMEAIKLSKEYRLPNGRKPSEEDVEQKMFEVSPHGFISIPGETPDGRELIAYKAFEVLQTALRLIKNPITSLSAFM